MHTFAVLQFIWSPHAKKRPAINPTHQSIQKILSNCCMSLHQLQPGNLSLLRPGPTTAMLQFSNIIIVFGSCFRVNCEYITRNDHTVMTSNSPLRSIVTQITFYPTVSSVLLLSMLMTGQNSLKYSRSNSSIHHKYVISHCTISTTAVNTTMLNKWNPHTMKGTS
jgi:hypothetical protein